MIKLIDLIKEDEAPKCPIATQNADVNNKHRELAIANHKYGPKNPNNPNVKFWKDKAMTMRLESVDAAKNLRCNSCAAFNITQRLLNCMGVQPEPEPKPEASPEPSVDYNPEKQSDHDHEQLRKEFMSKMGRNRIIKEDDGRPVRSEDPVADTKVDSDVPVEDEAPTEIDWDSIEAGKVGYCMLHKFKSTGSRTCNGYRQGGPYKDK